MVPAGAAFVAALLLQGLVVSPILACTEVNLTNVYVVGSDDIHPFDHDIPTSGGALSAASCETVQQIFDGDANTKWVQEFSGSSGGNTSETFVTFRLQTVPCVTKYTITSGNDVEGRDPAEWTLSGSSDGSTWEVLDYEEGVTFSKRQQTLEFPVKFSRHYSWFRFDFFAVRDEEAGGNLIQFSSFSFFTGALRVKLPLFNHHIDSQLVPLAALCLPLRRRLY